MSLKASRRFGPLSAISKERPKPAGSAHVRFDDGIPERREEAHRRRPPDLRGPGWPAVVDDDDRKLPVRGPGRAVDVHRQLQAVEGRHIHDRGLDPGQAVQTRSRFLPEGRRLAGRDVDRVDRCRACPASTSPRSGTCRPRRSTRTPRFRAEGPPPPSASASSRRGFGSRSDYPRRGSVRHGRPGARRRGIRPRLPGSASRCSGRARGRSGRGPEAAAVRRRHPSPRRSDGRRPKRPRCRRRPWARPPADRSTVRSPSRGRPASGCCRFRFGKRTQRAQRPSRETSARSPGCSSAYSLFSSFPSDPGERETE